MARESHGLVDLRHLRTVVEVARAASITTAAQTLGLTQSAVSRTVAEMEAALGARLFDRLPRGIKLTEAGVRLVDGAKRVLGDVDDILADVTRASHPLSGRLRLGVTTTGWYANPAIVAFARAHPDVALETVHASDQALCPRLLQGEVDFVLGSSRYLKRWRELEVVELAPLNFACMLRKGHPLARRKRVREPEVLAYPIIMPANLELAHADIAQRYAQHDLPALKPLYVTSHFELAKQLLNVTDAFFPIMHPAADFGGLGRDFLLIENTVQLPQHSLAAARAAHRPRTRVAELFEACLQETLSSTH